MKGKITDELLIMGMLIALAITSIALFFVTEGIKITGFVTRDYPEPSSAFMIYLVLFLVVLTAAVVIFALHLSSKKK